MLGDCCWFYASATQLMQGGDFLRLPAEARTSVGSWYVQLSYLTKDSSKAEKFARHAIDILEPLATDPEPSEAHAHLANVYGALAKALILQQRHPDAKEAIDHIPSLVEKFPQAAREDLLAMRSEILDVIDIMLNQ